MHNHCALAPLDHARQHGKRGGQTAVAVREDVDVGTLGPVHVQRRVDRGLDVVAVEIQWRDLRLREGPRESEDIPEDGPLERKRVSGWLKSVWTACRAYRVEDAVYVEGRVDKQGGAEDRVPDVATVTELDARARQRKQALGRVRHVLLHVASVVASRSGLVEVLHEGLAAQGDPCQV